MDYDEEAKTAIYVHRDEMVLGAIPLKGKPDTDKPLDQVILQIHRIDLGDPDTCIRICMTKFPFMLVQAINRVLLESHEQCALGVKTPDVYLKATLKRLDAKLFELDFVLTGTSVTGRANGKQSGKVRLNDFELGYIRLMILEMLSI